MDTLPCKQFCKENGAKLHAHPDRWKREGKKAPKQERIFPFDIFPCITSKEGSFLHHTSSARGGRGGKKRKKENYWGIASVAPLVLVRFGGGGCVWGRGLES